MKYHISETEREVMDTVWNYEEGIRQSDLLTVFHDKGRDWKRQTLNTFLARLEEKGLVTREKRIVKPVISREEFQYREMRETVDTMYGGRLSNLLLAFTKREGIDREEAQRLLRIIEQS